MRAQVNIALTQKMVCDSAPIGQFARLIVLTVVKQVKSRRSRAGGLKDGEERSWFRGANREQVTSGLRVKALTATALATIVV